MIDLHEAKKHLDNDRCFRFSKNSRSITLFKSKDTPEIYYWYVIHDMPIKIKDNPTLIKGSDIYYRLSLMISDINNDKDAF